MGAGYAAIVAWGFIVPEKNLHALYTILRKLRYPDDPDTEEESSHAGENAENLPSKKPRRILDDEEFEDLNGLVEDIMRDRKGWPEDMPLLWDIFSIAPVESKGPWGGQSIAIYYEGEYEVDGKDGKPVVKSREHSVDRWGDPDDHYTGAVMPMGRNMSPDDILKSAPEGIGARLREALCFKEAGIEVEDQWILVMSPR